MEIIGSNQVSATKDTSVNTSAFLGTNPTDEPITLRFALISGCQFDFRRVALYFNRRAKGF